MNHKKFRWSKVYESSEEELIAFLQARGITSDRVHLDAGVAQVNQRTTALTTIWCAEGSLVITSKSSKASLQPGDALRLDADSTYTTQAGITDCGYYLSI